VDEDHELRTINAVDSGLLELKAAVENLNIQIESVQTRIKEYGVSPLIIQIYT
jgi:hypothetical protein